MLQSLLLVFDHLPPGTGASSLFSVSLK